MEAYQYTWNGKSSKSTNKEVYSEISGWLLSKISCNDKLQTGTGRSLTVHYKSQMLLQWFLHRSRYHLARDCCRRAAGPRSSRLGQAGRIRRHRKWCRNHWNSICKTLRAISPIFLGRFAHFAVSSVLVAINIIGMMGKSMKPLLLHFVLNAHIHEQQLVDCTVMLCLDSIIVLPPSRSLPSEKSFAHGTNLSSYIDVIWSRWRSLCLIPA